LAGDAGWGWQKQPTLVERSGIPITRAQLLSFTRRSTFMERGAAALRYDSLLSNKF